MKALWLIGCLVVFAGIATYAGLTVYRVHFAAPHTVSWFLDHEQELAEARAYCNDNPGANTPECVNATAAYWQKSVNDLAAEGMKH